PVALAGPGPRVGGRWRPARSRTSDVLGRGGVRPGLALVPVRRAAPAAVAAAAPDEVCSAVRTRPDSHHRGGGAGRRTAGPGSGDRVRR
ncbi:MAG: hypothetical protein WCH11_05690, partial [Bdellovibrio sp.]